MKLARLIRDDRTRVLILAALDGLYILVAFLFAVRITLQPEESFAQSAASHAVFYLIFLGFWCWVAVDRGLWEEGHNEDTSGYLSSVTNAIFGAMVFSVFVTVPIANKSLDRDFLALFCLGTIVAITVFRGVIQSALHGFHLAGYHLEPVLIIGANNRSVHLAELLKRRPGHGYRIEGFLEEDPARIQLLEGMGIAHLGGFSDLNRVLAEHPINEVYIALPVRSCYETIQAATRVCEDHGVSVELMADLFPLRIARSSLLYLDDVPLISLSAVPEARGELALKRALDITVSSILLVGLSPMFLLTALLIKLDSPGPVFFRQARAGKNGRQFMMIKFRSMRKDAEKLRESLQALNEIDGPAFKIRNDPRVTRFGRFIRKYSIDEFPQLINVWIGEMSLVGPRPPVLSDATKYTWDQRRRLSVKPGMTGLWQVSGRSDTSFEELVELDLKYIDNWSLMNDFQILFKTFDAVVKGRGAV